MSMNSTLDEVSAKCARQLRAYRMFPECQVVFAGVVTGVDGSRDVCFYESRGLGKEM